MEAFSIDFEADTEMAYKGFQYTIDRNTNTDAGVKIYRRCENSKCKLFLFFLYKSVFDQFRLNFDVIRRIFDQLP